MRVQDENGELLDNALLRRCLNDAGQLHVPTRTVTGHIKPELRALEPPPADTKELKYFPPMHNP